MKLTFLTVICFFLPVLGLQVTAIAFLVGYVVYFATVNILAHTLQGFRWQPLSLQLLALHVTLALALLALARTAPHAAAIASVCLALATGLFGLRVALRKVGKHGRLPTQMYGIFARLGWPIQSTVEGK